MFSRSLNRCATSATRQTRIITPLATRRTFSSTPAIMVWTPFVTLPWLFSTSLFSNSKFPLPGQRRRLHPQHRPLRGLTRQQGQPLSRAGLGQRRHHRCPCGLLSLVLRATRSRLHYKRQAQECWKGVCYLGQRRFRVRHTTINRV